MARLMSDIVLVYQVCVYIEFFNTFTEYIQYFTCIAIAMMLIEDKKVISVT